MKNKNVRKIIGGESEEGEEGVCRVPRVSESEIVMEWTCPWVINHSCQNWVVIIARHCHPEPGL